VLSWVKNSFLDFRIPYIDKAGEQRDYYPDFIVRGRNGETTNLLLEITGMSRDKAEKKWTVENRWLPAVNRIREQYGWDKWDFLEIADEAALADLRNILLKRLAVSSVWKDRAAYEREHGRLTEEFELPPRRVGQKGWGKNPLED
jgi:type III restriction enzyme